VINQVQVQGVQHRLWNLGAGSIVEEDERLRASQRREMSAQGFCRKRLLAGCPITHNSCVHPSSLPPIGIVFVPIILDAPR
jgi:DNA-binding transcriptional regulator PaaX